MRSRRAPLPVRPGVLVLAGALLAGCGSSSSENGVASKTPAEIFAAAKSAAAGAATVHVAGSILSARKPISIDMELVAGKGGQGRLTLGGRSIELLKLNRTVYVDGSAAFYGRFLPAAAARRLGGKWLRGPAAGGPLAPLASLAEMSGLLDGVLADHGALAHAGTRTLDGQKVVGVTDLAKGGTLYVAATGTPYPIEIVDAGRSGGGVLFDRWNKPVTLTAPANVIEIGQPRSGR